MKEFYSREWNVAEKLLLSSTLFLLGAVFGFLISPIKGGVSCGNNSGNMYEKERTES